PPGRKPLLSSPLDIDLSNLGEAPAAPPPAKPAAPPPRVSSGLGLKPPTSSRASTPDVRSSAPEISISSPPPREASAAPPKPPEPVAAKLTPPPAASPPPPIESRPAEPARPPEAAREPAAEPASRPQPRAPVTGPKPNRPANAEGLSDTRLREIYSQYVQARRDRNESTAGITFEKLSESLRSQADKLKEKHAAKRVDYEVVVKEGKTLIKPIVR
ncbi:MAG TPA: MXAN_5187 C-terminal domain-containing protein, partial [Polyangiaceae bacterium]|nr:MXAN_5187 C-terminal domain-containing protein [Polyangiaceae bacterium]